MKYFHREEQKHWITEYGFEECTATVVGLPCQYEACLWHNSGLYNTWVGVDFNKQLVHIYKEYLSGGEIVRETIDVSYVDTEDEHSFMTELDALVEKYLAD
jgi:hypothetical protein